jgi:tetratricopeptide (TPR) repeat protein
MGNYRQSVASLTDAIRLAPRNPDGYFNRGTSYFQLGDFEAAIADFSMAIKFSPGDEEAYYWRGVSNEEAGRQEEAAADYRQFLAISQNLQAREEVEQRLLQWRAREQKGAGRQDVGPSDRQKTDPPPLEESDRNFDLHSLIAALGERALRSIWFGSGVECYGENVEELHALTDQNQPIEGRELLRITSGIRQTIAGDFQAFDPEADAPWIFIRAWDGSGFYVETSDPKIKEGLQAQFQDLQEVEGAQPPYESLFIPV